MLIDIIYVKLKWVSFKICILYFVLCSACTHFGNIDISRRTIKCHVFSLAVLENESKHKVHPNIKTGKVDKWSSECLAVIFWKM